MGLPIHSSTACQPSQGSILRERLLTLGAQVSSSTRRILIRLPQQTPFADPQIRSARLASGPLKAEPQAGPHLAMHASDPGQLQTRGHR